MKYHLHFLQSVPVKRDGCSKVRFRKRALFKKGKRHCHYCGILLNLTGAPADKNYATLEHIYSRMDIRRLLSDFKRDTVLCCEACNSSRNISEFKTIYKGFDYNASAFTIDPVHKTIILSPEIFKTA